MNSTKNDLAFLEGIPPNKLTKFLIASGWKQVPIQTPKKFEIAIFRKLRGAIEEEILVPLNQEFADYAQRIQDLFKKISYIESLPFEEVIDNVLSYAFDTLRLRLSGDSIQDGSITLLDEMAAKDGFKKVLLAISCYTLQPKPFYKKLKRSEADNLLRKCRLGQSEKGSYIIKFYFPLDEELENENESKPFTRKVTENLMNSLYHLVNLVQTNDEKNMSRMKNNINSNFCFGLVEMQSPNSKLNFDFHMSWSPEFPVDDQVPTKVSVRESFLPVIAKIGETLKPQQEITENEFVGKISSLCGIENESGKMEGDVIFSLLIDDESKRVKAYLEAEFYGQACDAHKENKNIQITGLFKERPRISDLENIVNFEVISK